MSFQLFLPEVRQINWSFIKQSKSSHIYSTACIQAANECYGKKTAKAPVSVSFSSYNQRLPTHQWMTYCTSLKNFAEVLPHESGPVAWSQSYATDNFHVTPLHSFWTELSKPGISLSLIYSNHIKVCFSQILCQVCYSLTAAGSLVKKGRCAAVNEQHSLRLVSCTLYHLVLSHLVAGWKKAKVLKTWKHLQ